MTTHRVIIGHSGLEVSIQYVGTDAVAVQSAVVVAVAWGIVEGTALWTHASWSTFMHGAATTYCVVRHAKWLSSASAQRISHSRAPRPVSAHHHVVVEW